MARMVRMIVSLPEEDKKWIGIEAKRRRISGAQVIRMSVRETRLGVETKGSRGKVTRIAEKHAEYGHLEQATEGIVEKKELWRRAVEAAGRFASGVPDLSVGHDRYAWGDAEEGGAERPENAGRGGKRGAR